MNDARARGLRHALVLAGVLLAWPAAAQAHGLVPAVVGVLTEDEAGPDALQLSEGVAVRIDDGTWRWVCPALWGGPDTPIVGGSDARGVYVAGIDDLHVVAPSATLVTALETPEVGATRARAMARDALDDDVLWALVNDPADGVATALWRLGVDAPERVAGFEGNWYNLVADGAGDLVFVRPTTEGELLMGRMAIAEPGALVEVTIVGPAIGSPVVRSDGTELYLAMRVGLDHELWRVAEDGQATFLVRAVAASILGPVRRADGQVTVVVDGVLTKLDPATGTTDVLDDSQLYTCLQARRGAEPGEGVVCAGAELFALDDIGIGERLFALEDLQPWLPDGLDDETAATCTADWTDFAVDAGLIEPPPMDEADTVEAPDVAETSDAAEPDTDAPDVVESADTAGDLQVVDTAVEVADDAPPPDPSGGDAGCGCRSVGGGAPDLPWGVGLVWAALGALLVRRTRTRRSRGLA